MAQLRLVRFQELTAMDIKITAFWNLQGNDEAAGCSTMFICLHQTECHHIPEDHNLNMTCLHYKMV